ncbi:hypothetical protein TNCV_4701261 [Trichonephila clavipes]|nr:hypothetical protein TNCV_4701261 [Trichonephila clavipes]
MAPKSRVSKNDSMDENEEKSGGYDFSWCEKFCRQAVCLARMQPFIDLHVLFRTGGFLELHHGKTSFSIKTSPE